MLRAELLRLCVTSEAAATALRVGELLCGCCAHCDSDMLVVQGRMADDRKLRRKVLKRQRSSDYRHALHKRLEGRSQLSNGCESEMLRTLLQIAVLQVECAL